MSVASQPEARDAALPEDGIGAASARIEDVLESEGVFVSTTAGLSMWPLLRDRRDVIEVRPSEGRLRRFDVALYRRGSAYILHRVVEVQEGSYVMLGDNCPNKEFGVREDQVIGVLTGLHRGERAVDLGGAAYRAYVRVWYACYPLRRPLMRLRAGAARLKRRARFGKRDS